MYHLPVKRILTLYIIREISSLFLLGIVIFTLVLLMGLVAGVYPAFRASSMKPIEAIRKGE